MKTAIILLEQSKHCFVGAIESLSPLQGEIEFISLEGHNNSVIVQYIQDNKLGPIHQLPSKSLDQADRYRALYKSDIVGDPVVRPFINTIHINSIRPLFRRMRAIEDCLKEHSFERMILVGGNAKLEYFTTFYGEGEVPLRYLYKPSWYYNYYLNKEFSDRYNVIWKNQDAYFKLRLFKCFRRFSLIPIKLFVYQVLRLFYSLTEKKVAREKKDKIICSLRSSAQANTVSSLIEGLPSHYQKITFSHDLIQSPGEGARFAKRLPALSIYSHMRLRHMLSYFVLWIKVQLRKSELLNQSFVSSKELLLECLSTYDEYYLKRRALENLLDSFDVKTVRAFFSTETYGHTALLEKDVCSERGIPYYNVQNVIYEFDWIPQFPIADKTFLFSADTSWIEESELQSCVVVGPVWLDSYYGSELSYKDKRQVSIFTQPDSYTTHYLEILKSIITNKDLFAGMTFVVKPHPRETAHSIRLYEKICESSSGQMVLAGKKEKSLEIINQSFCVISVSSTVIFESCLMGVPSMGYNPHGQHIDHSNNYPHLSEDFIFVIKQVDQILSVINHLKSDSEQFGNKRKLAFSHLLKDYNGDALKKIRDVCKI